MLRPTQACRTASEITDSLGAPTNARPSWGCSFEKRSAKFAQFSPPQILAGTLRSHARRDKSFGIFVPRQAQPRFATQEALKRRSHALRSSTSMRPIGSIRRTNRGCCLSQLRCALRNALLRRHSAFRPAWGIRKRRRNKCSRRACHRSRSLFSFHRQNQTSSAHDFAPQRRQRARVPQGHRISERFVTQSAAFQPLPSPAPPCRKRDDW